MLQALKEVPLYKPYEIARIGDIPVMMTMANSGHLQSLPAVSVKITL